jgi:hypothetical protein
MLELLAVGRLHSAASFPARDVAPAEVLSIPVDVGFPEAWYQELIEPLAAGGRSDLVEAIQTKLQEFQRQQRWMQEKDWKGYVKRFDRKFLRSALYQSYRTTRQLARSAINKPHFYAGATFGLSFSTELLGAVG